MGTQNFGSRRELFVDRLPAPRRGQAGDSGLR